ncbi:MAG: hypothetical protein Ct9H300mP13_4980 [Gammaproteobacteria bacterium]|nr:MAG: hypothetical protein Ct9H300mP13_4980 [Gammaproteobacteria bacterium]
MKEIIADYEKLNPGIKVNQEPIPWGDLDQKMQAPLRQVRRPMRLTARLMLSVHYQLRVCYCPLMRL